MKNYTILLVYATLLMAAYYHINKTFKKPVTEAEVGW